MKLEGRDGGRGRRTNDVIVSNCWRKDGVVCTYSSQDVDRHKRMARNEKVINTKYGLNVVENMAEPCQ